MDNLFIFFSINSLFALSNEAVGSSITMILLLRKKDRNNHTICFCPPDKLLPSNPTDSFILGLNTLDISSIFKSINKSRMCFSDGGSFNP